MFPLSVAYVLGAILGLVLTIVVYVKIMPRHLDGLFESDLTQTLHDFFHFKKLYLEEVLKFVYVLATISVVAIGVMCLLGYTESFYFDYSKREYIVEKESTYLIGLAMIIAGPIGLRLTYEVLMMFVLLVKNTIEINNKLSAAQLELAAETAEETGSIIKTPANTATARKWKCICGKENADYVLTCSCGTTKQHATQNIAPGRTNNGWRCTCGKEHPLYVSSCSCGKNKVDVL